MTYLMRASYISKLHQYLLSVSPKRELMAYTKKFVSTSTLLIARKHDARFLSFLTPSNMVTHSAGKFQNFKRKYTSRAALRKQTEKRQNGLRKTAMAKVSGVRSVFLPSLAFPEKDKQLPSRRTM